MLWHNGIEFFKLSTRRSNVLGYSDGIRDFGAQNIQPGVTSDRLHRRAARHVAVDQRLIQVRTRPGEFGSQRGG